MWRDAQTGAKQEGGQSGRAAASADVLLVTPSGAAQSTALPGGCAPQTVCASTAPSCCHSPLLPAAPGKLECQSLPVPDCAGIQSPGSRR